MTHFDEREGYLETTLSDLLSAIDQVSETDEEAFAVLENMLAEGRISIVGRQERGNRAPSMLMELRGTRATPFSPPPPRAA